MQKAVVFGAGAVGRGFIGQLLSEAGWFVTFLDVQPDLVKHLAMEGSYPHVTVTNDDSERTLIRPVTAIDARDTGAACAALLEADLAVSCVGARVLPAVADTLATAVSSRIAAGLAPLDVLLAENLHGASTVMRGLLSDRLPDLGSDELDAAVGLMETSIGRMIPAPDPSRVGSDLTAVFVEPYKMLPYDDTARRGALIDVPGLVADTSVPFAFYGDRKLYVHNLGHCMTAYLGEVAGATTIAEAIAIPAVRYFVRSAMVESAVALASTYSVSLVDLLAHVDDLLHRFGNRALGDTVARVGREPLRKLAAHDRLLGALDLAAAYGLPGHHLSLAVAAGAYRVLRTEGWGEPQLWSHLEVSLADGVLEPRRQLLASQIDALKRGFDYNAQITLIEKAYEPSHIV
ncbi:MAG: hypothetical protein VB080_12740 [Propionicimonas sp.]|uniref:mannitol dehydrogenase family protein n=1 Tax=Propionicimonas sp. TaxID=1955623 RepID=UPI002B207EC1|nr:hypothetical protein [Propionicimonas sp.]MEA4945290.1 hypothetical protein [Propionicimonas sp.]